MILISGATGSLPILHITITKTSVGPRDLCMLYSAKQNDENNENNITDSNYNDK